MLGRMTFAFLVLVFCLISSLIAAPLAGTDGKQQKGNEINGIILTREGPQLFSWETASRPEVVNSTKASRKEGETESKGENGLLESIFGTLLAFPNYVATGLETLLNGVVGRLLGSGLKIKTSDSEDFR